MYGDMSTSNHINTDLIKFLGNSWIICRSKSYAGRIYYFNIESGEAVWNLSDPEIEKAKKTTTFFQKHSNFNYPEPSGSPDNSFKDINFSDLQHPTNKNTPNYQIIKFSSPISTNEPANYYPLNTIQLNSQLNSVSTSYNPIVWNIPPSECVLVPPVHQPPLALNDHDEFPVSNTPITLSNRFKSFSETNNMALSMNNINQSLQSPSNRFFALNSTFSKRDLSKTNSELDNMDLRLLLRAKRRMSNNNQAEVSTPSLTNYICSNQGIIEGCDNNKCRVECKDLSSNLLTCNDDYWLEENMLLNGFSNTIDTRAIRNIIGADDNLDQLHIVTDTSVLMNDINFLNMLLYSDMQCHLVVPQVVMDNIESAISTNVNTQAQKAANLISKHLESGFGSIVKSIGHNIDYKYEIINCCLKLVEKSCHMILLTNDESILQLKNETNIPMLSVNETKKLACNILFNKMNKNSFETLDLKNESNIKITVDNDKINSIKDNSEVPYQYSTNGNGINICTDTYEDVLGLNSADTSNKMTLDALDVDTSVLTNEKKDQQESTQVCSINTDNESQTSARKTQLKRSISNNNEISSMTNERRHYKWHRKRTKHCHCNVSNDHVTPFSCIQLESVAQTSNIGYTQSNSSHIPNESLNNQHNILSSHSSSSKSSLSDYKDISVQQKVNTEKPRKYDHVTKHHEKDGHSATADHSTNNNVMFEVTSQVMEDCLKMKCDEWVSRFFQIMEEVLTQLLQKDSTLVYDIMPPPWTVYEATECIKRIFYNDCDVVDAANKFCNVLFELGGLRGQVKANISPQKYMEMYSYGVYLIDSLQGFLNNCEDVDTAAESLSKLLSDIQETNLDQSNYDSFGDIHEVSYTEIANNATDTLKNIKGTSPLGDINKIQKLPIHTNTVSPTNYKLRSQSKKKLLLHATDINSESNFFTCLNLQRNPITDHSNKIVIEKESSFQVDKVDCYIPKNNDQSSKNKTNNLGRKAKQIQNNAEPKIIRNFVRCLDLEEKLKSKFNATHFNETDCYEDDEPDYDGKDVEYCESDEHDENEIDAYHRLTKESTTNNDTDRDKSLNKRDDGLKCVIQEVLREAKDAFCSIYTFCKMAHDQFISPESGGRRLKKSEYAEAEKTHLYILEICSLLDSILKRETSNSEYCIQNITKTPEFRAYKINKEELIDYRRVVKKYLEQGNLLKKSVRLLIKASEQ